MDRGHLKIEISGDVAKIILAIALGMALLFGVVHWRDIWRPEQAPALEVTHGR